jgi:hypothetical protein
MDGSPGWCLETSPVPMGSGGRFSIDCLASDKIRMSTPSSNSTQRATSLKAPAGVHLAAGSLVDEQDGGRPEPAGRGYGSKAWQGCVPDTRFLFNRDGKLLMIWAKRAFPKAIRITSPRRVRWRPIGTFSAAGRQEVNGNGVIKDARRTENSSKRGERRVMRRANRARCTSACPPGSKRGFGCCCGRPRTRGLDYPRR